MYKIFTNYFGIPPGYAKKILFTMKVFVVIMLTAILQAKAVTTFAQKITLNEKNVSLLSVIKKIRHQSGYDFVYNDDLISGFKNVQVSLVNGSVEQALNQSLKDLALTYTIQNKMIIIKRKVFSDVKADSVITGRVLDAVSRKPIAGVTVTIKNTKTAVQTKVNGSFSILTEKGAKLVFSYIGYETKEITVTQKVLEVRLTETAESLKGVVVTGIVDQSKSTFTGAARTFNAAELAKASNNSVLSALTSLDPSFQIPENLSVGSNPNVLPDVVLRGGNTLVDIRQTGAADPFNYQASPNAPLFILDGFETTLQRVNDLDINRVAGVTVLKDAGATAIYGSRGANGVIVIELKKPVEGKLQFTYNASMKLEAPDLSDYNLLNAEEKFNIEDRSGFFVHISGFNPNQNRLDLIRANRLAAVKSGINTDWMSKPLTTGIGQKHNMAIDGGSESVTYGMSLSYDQTKGVMKGSDRTALSGNSFISYRFKNFQFRNDLQLYFTDANNSPYGSFLLYTRLNSYWTPYDANGNLKLYLESVDDGFGGRITDADLFDNLNGYTGRPVNPLYNASLNITDKTSSRAITNNFSTLWQARTWLRLTGRLSYTTQNDGSDIFIPAQHTSFANTPTFEKGSYTQGTGTLRRFESFLSGEANKVFNKHLLSASATLNMGEVQSSNQSIRAVGFPNPNLDQLILANQYSPNQKPTGSESLSRSVGVLARGAYAYDNRYLFDATYRLDGSSLFGSDKRYGSFWSLGAGWNFKNESFLASSEMISDGRLRYTVGTTGSQSFASYLGITTSQYYTDRDYRGVIASYLLGYGNSALAWQKTLKHNIGLDLTLFNQFNFTGNYFVERTKGSIAFISSAPSTGFSGYSANMGDVVNKGYELYGRYNIIANASSRNNWSVFVNAFHVSNKIEKISATIKALNNRANTTKSVSPLPRYAEGQSVNVIWGVQSLGIDPASGTELFLKRDGTVTAVYDPLDQVIIGDRTPTLSGTMGTSFEYKGIGLNVFLRFNFGGDAYNQTLVDRVENANVALYNVDKRVYEDRWLNPGDVALYRGIVDYNLTVAQPITYATSRFVQKNNFFAGENASIYYRLSDKLNKRLGVQNTRFTIYGSDIFQISSIKRERGIAYPFARNVTLQLQTTF